MAEKKIREIYSKERQKIGLIKMLMDEFIISENNELSQLKANSTFFIKAPEKGNH